MKEMTSEHSNTLTITSVSTPIDSLHVASLLIDMLSTWKNNESTAMEERKHIVDDIGLAIEKVMHARCWMIAAINLANEIELRKWPHGFPKGEP